MHLKYSFLSGFFFSPENGISEQSFKEYALSATTQISDLDSQPELSCLGKRPKAASVSISEK